MTQICNRLSVLRLGRMPYGSASTWQHEQAARVGAGDSPGVLGVLQHEPVYTLGVRASRQHVLASAQWLHGHGVEVVKTDRGGDVTFHGPGQLVAYPILNVRARGLGPASYVRLLERCVIETVGLFGIEAERVPGRPGVWVDRGAAKIAAIGVRIRDGISTHGLALNVSTDLTWFDAIVPCGIADAGVTSMAGMLDRAPPHEMVEDAFIDVFARLFDVSVVDWAVSAPR